MKQIWRILIGAAFVALSVAAHAQVRVTKSAGEKSAIDWSGLQADGSASAGLFLKTLQNDLLRSGWFLRGSPGRSEYNILGEVDGAGSALKVKCQVYEVSSRDNLLSKSFRGDAVGAERLAHQVADAIIEAVTGKKGMFSGRLLVVGNRTGSKELYLCDATGGGLVQLTRDKSISLSPKWSPDGESIVYTSFIGKFPDTYLIDVTSGSRRKLAGYPGLNTGGEISPDGRDLALILSKDGNPELYVMNLKSRKLNRITETLRAGEASPAWSPDGSQIVFVSDLPGSPQLYVVSRDGGPAKRITGRVAQSVAPDWGAGGLITYSALIGGRYQVCVLDPSTLQSKQITSDGADYEDPCWAPDGRHIACGRTVAHRSTIYLLDTLGDPPIALLDSQGNWFSPAWSSK